MKNYQNQGNQKIWRPSFLTFLLAISLIILSLPAPAASFKRSIAAADTTLKTRGGEAESPQGRDCPSSPGAILWYVH